MAAVTQVTATIVHDVDDGTGRSVKIVLEGLAGPSFELYAEPEASGGLNGELHVLGADGERNHGSKPFLLQSEPQGKPLATAQALADQAWEVIKQEYTELIEQAKAARDRQLTVALVTEARLRRQQVLGDIVQAFTPQSLPKWTGWRKAHVAARLASNGLKLADELGVTGPALDQFYDIAAKAMQGDDVKTFSQFEQKLRTGLGPQFPQFLKALGGYTGLRPVWDAVTEHDPEDLQHSLEDLRISPRIPSAVQETKRQRKVPLEDPHGAARLQPDLAAMVRDPATLAHNVNLMLQYPEFSSITGATDAEKAEHIIEHMVDNLTWLYKQWKGVHQNRSKAWYVGGSRIVHRWSERFHVAPQAVAGVLASLSPQQHWFQNVTLAERVISALVEHADQPWDDAMTQVVLTRTWGGKVKSDSEEEIDDPEADDLDNEEPEPDDLESTPDTSPAAGQSFAPAELDMESTKKLKPYALLGNLQGKSLQDLEGSAPMNLYLSAIWVRAYDEAHNPNGCRNVSPEGEFGDWYRTDKGAPVKNRWNSFGEIMKALRVFKDPSVRNISDVVGANHKVRSFYNNLIAPLSQGGDVTIDTHAVAAALVRPLSSSSIEVLHNFGSGKAPVTAKPAVPAHINPATGRMVPRKPGRKAAPGLPGPSSSKVTGNTGLYGFYAEAYRRAAKALGIQPREMQSITWECVRGLFKPAQKRDKKFVKNVESQWRRYSSGISSKDTTRNNILTLAGNGDPARAVEPPAWSMAHPGDAEGTRDSSYAGGLPGDLAAGAGSGGPDAPGGGAGTSPRAAAGVGSRGRVVAKLLQPRARRTAEKITNDTYSMSLQDAINEHEKLVHALKTPSHKDDAEEAKEQGGELKEMQEAKRKKAKLLQPRAQRTAEKIEDGVYSPQLRHRAKLLQKKAAPQSFTTLAIVPVRDSQSRAQATTPYFKGEAARAALQELRTEHVLSIPAPGGFDILDVKFLGFQWDYDEDYPGKTAFYQVQLSGDSAVVAKIEREKAQKIQNLLSQSGAIAPQLRSSRTAKLLQPKVAADLKPVNPVSSAAAPTTLRNFSELVRWMSGYLANYKGTAVVEGYLAGGKDLRMSFLMGPDPLGDDDTIAFTEGFQGIVRTTYISRPKLNGKVMAQWAASKIPDFPMTALLRITKLPSFAPMTPEQIAAGDLDKMLAPYPDTMFQLWLLKSWATQNYTQAGDEGSSRICFQLDEDYALKIALNPKGNAQNLTESHLATNFHDLPITQVHHTTKGGMALLVDFAHALVPADFKRDFGLDFQQFCEQVRKLCLTRDTDVQRSLMASLPAPARKLMDSLKRHGLAATDLLRSEQWGDVKHHAVIIDYGLTHKVWDEHYKPFIKPPQPATQPKAKAKQPGAVQAPQGQPAKIGKTASQSPRSHSVYDGYCPACGQPGCRGECTTQDGSTPPQSLP